MDFDREKCFQICQGFLEYKAWKSLDINLFIMEPLMGGLSNKLYKCSLPADSVADGYTPREVLIRQYGPLILDSPGAMTQDTLVFGLLAERRVGPKLFGTFPEGRLEQFVPNSRPLKTLELHRSDYSQGCARIIAELHKLQMPINKQPGWLLSIMTSYWDQIKNNMAAHESNLKKKELFEQVVSFNLEKELEDLRKILDGVESPIMFCHNDLQEGNILIVENNQSGWKLIPIDYEFCNYNHRGFDFANHFCEWTFDYTYNKPPFFKHCPQDYPTAEQQLNFIRAYLETFPDCPIADEQHILKEARHHALASHMLWALWATVQAAICDIEFGYLEYALTRLKTYRKIKEELPK